MKKMYEIEYALKYGDDWYTYMRFLKLDEAKEC